MLKIGITGGIGSGKTTVCKHIESLGYTVYYADKIAKDLINTNYDLRNKLINEFGDNTFINGDYNTSYISSIVFNDKNRLNKLNEIFKPFLDDIFNHISKGFENVIFYESALIFEHKIEHKFDYIINITAWEHDIIERLQKRDNISKEEILLKINSQLSVCDKIKYSDFNINTSVDDELWKSILEIIINHMVK